MQPLIDCGRVCFLPSQQLVAFFKDMGSFTTFGVLVLALIVGLGQKSVDACGGCGPCTYVLFLRDALNNLLSCRNIRLSNSVF